MVGNLYNVMQANTNVKPTNNAQPDMEKVSIIPRTRFVNNQNFLECIDQNLHM